MERVSLFLLVPVLFISLGACRADSPSAESSPADLQSASSSASPIQSGQPAGTFSDDASDTDRGDAPEVAPGAHTVRDDPVVLTDDMVPPKKISGDHPDFHHPRCRIPVAAVVFRSIIDREGRVQDLEFLKPVEPCVEAAVREAVGTWTFSPAQLVTGEPVAVYYNMSMHIRIQ